MRRFAYRAIREALFGLAAGGVGAIALRSVIGLSVNILGLLEPRFPLSTIDSIIRGRDFEILTFIIALCLLLLSAPRVIAFLFKLFRSWSTGLFIGVFPVWFLLALLFFVPEHEWTLKRSLIFVCFGMLFVLASRVIVVMWQRNATASPIVIPEPSQVEVPIEPGVKFDLPIQAWSQDRLKRGTLIREMAEQVLVEKAPVLAIIGSFGEGKTSALNLLAASLADRSDVILVRFSSWLPGDPQTLAFSLFATISEQIKSRYLIFGLSNRLRKFARLLAGSIPRFGDNLRQMLEPPSQMEQLDSLKKLLGELTARVVILVDEIDRLDRAELFVLLKAIRGVVDLPNITYVCAFDKRAVVRLISRKDLAYGEFYLEKFFPVKMALPAVDDLLLSAVFDRELENVCQTFGLLQDEKEKKAFGDETRALWQSSMKHILTNFRRMTLFFNAMRTALASVYAEVNLFDMMVLQLVRLISEDTYDFIWAHGPVFYYSSWRIDLWEERLSADDNREAEIRKKILDAFFQTLTVPLRNQVTELLGRIFPTVNDSLEGRRHSLRGRSEDVAEEQRRIYHPNYFARYFIHQVQANLFGKREMSALISELNAERDLTGAVAKFRRMIDTLPDYWRRLSFLDALVQDCRRLGNIQAEAVVIAVSQITDLLQADVMGMGDWGKARAIIFVAANRFAGTSKLQELLVRSISESSSDGFAADILRFSTKMRPRNNVVTNWQHVDEQTILNAFAERMRTRHAVGSAQQPPYNRREEINSFFIWAGINDEARSLEIEYFRDRFQRYPAERGSFVGWLLPKHGLMYGGDPLLAIEKLFPLDELLDLVERVDKELLNEAAESVNWFIELMGKRKAVPTLDDGTVT